MFVCVFVCLQVILTEVYSTGFQRSFFDEEDLTSIAENDVIYAFQAPPLYIRGGSARISGIFSLHTLSLSITGVWYYSNIFPYFNVEVHIDQ